MKSVEKRSEGWFVVERSNAFGGYSATSAVSKRQRIPVSNDAPRDQAVFVARQAGMLDAEE